MKINLLWNLISMFGRIENEFRALCESDSTSKVFVAALNRKLESVNGVTDYRTERDPKRSMEWMPLQLAATGILSDFLPDKCSLPRQSMGAG